MPTDQYFRRRSDGKIDSDVTAYQRDQAAAHGINSDVISAEAIHIDDETCRADLAVRSIGKQCGSSAADRTG